MLILGCASQPAPAVPTAPATQLQTPAVPVATSNTTTTAAPTVISQPPVANPGKIIFMSSRETLNIPQLFSMNIDGSDLKRLTDSVGGNYYPDWSPDRKKIAFNSNRDGYYHIYTMKADGSDVIQITNRMEAVDGFPRWSPDGKKIAFNSTRNYNFDMYVMDAQTCCWPSSPRCQTHSPPYSWLPWCLCFHTFFPAYTHF